jgi:GNAT superfamily N-acetyltransferase
MAPVLDIHQADSSEARAITRLINRAFIVERFFVDGDRTTVEEISGRFRTGAFLLAAEDGPPVGSVYVELRQGGIGYIGLLAVDPDRKGRGIGKQLMHAAEEWCRAAGCAAVEISVVNLRTELFPFYAALGYEKLREQPFTDTLTKLPCHFVVMAKRLKD